MVQDGVAEGELLLDVGLFFGELASELGVGHRAGILELAEAGIGETREEVAVGDDSLEGTLTDIGDRAVLTHMDTKQVVDQIVGRDTGEVMNLVVQGDALPAPRTIDCVGDKDIFARTPCLLKLQVPLFTQGVVWNFVVYIRGRKAVYYGLRAIRGDTQADCTIVGDIEPVAVVRVMRHKPQGGARIGDCRL